jgi:hypothetical protein
MHTQWYKSPCLAMAVTCLALLPSNGHLLCFWVLHLVFCLPSTPMYEVDVQHRQYCLHLRGGRRQSTAPLPTLESPFLLSSKRGPDCQQRWGVGTQRGRRSHKPPLGNQAKKIPPIVARQRLGKNVTAATNTHATEELLDISFSMQSMSHQEN